MAEEFKENDDSKNGGGDVYENIVRAGKRTYFFDVRATKNNDYYLTITESKKKFADDGSFQYQKHKIFLYKEDFEKFGEALADSFAKIIELKNEQNENQVEGFSQKLDDIKFEDLGND